MPLPSNLLTLAEEHPCFSGVWHHDCSAQCVTDAAQPPRNVAVLRCADCLNHHLATDTQLLDPGVSARQLADEVAAHVRKHRGYAFSVGGYHTAGPGIWLSAAYWPKIGAFILSSRGSRLPLDALMDAIQHGAVSVPDPRMGQASLYTVQDVYLSVVPPPRVPSVNALLTSSNVSTHPKPGYRSVTIAAFKPVAQGVSTAPHGPPSLPVPKAQPDPYVPPRRRRVGERCPVCGEKVAVRALFHSTYIGCGCG